MTTREYEEPEVRDYSDLPPLDEEADPDEDVLRSIRERFGSNGYEVKVYRVTQSGKSYCFTDGPDISEESIRSNPYGGHGRFVLQVMVNGELRRVEQVNIEAPQAPAASGSGGAQDSAVVRLLERIEARLNAGPQEPMSNVLNAVVSLINNQNQKPQETTLDQFIKVFEVVRGMQPADSANDLTGILGGIAKQVAPVLLPALMGGGATASAPVVEGGQMSTDEMVLRQGIAFLKKKCMIGADPALYLDFILDNADDPRFGRLAQLAASEGFEFFVSLDAELGQPPYQPYFKLIYDGLRSALNPVHQVEVDTSRAGGDKANTSRNGAAGKGGSK